MTASQGQPKPYLCSSTGFAAYPLSALGRHCPPMSATCAAVTMPLSSSSGLLRLAAAVICPGCCFTSPYTHRVSG